MPEGAVGEPLQAVPSQVAETSRADLVAIHYIETINNKYLYIIASIKLMEPVKKSKEFSTLFYGFPYMMPTYLPEKGNSKVAAMSRLLQN